MILEPLILMLVFGYAFQANITDLNTIVIDKDLTLYSQTIIDAIDDSEYFNRIPFTGSLEEANELLRKSDVRAVFLIPEDFQATLDNATKADIHLYLDSSDYAIYNFLKGASAGVIKDSLHEIIQFIVHDLEEERSKKQDNIDEIQALIDKAEESSQTTLEKVTNLTNKFDETRDLITDTETKLDSSRREAEQLNSDVESIKVDMEKSLDTFDDLSTALNQIKVIEANLSIYIDPILKEVSNSKKEIEDSIEEVNRLKPLSKIPLSNEYYNMDDFNVKLNENEVIAQEINITAHELEDTYYEVQERIDVIYLELKTLKKEFLSHPLDIEREYLFGEISYFEYLTPAIMTLVLFFIGVMLTTINIVDERNTKTLFRVSTTPLKKIELFGGKFLVFLILGIIEVIYVLLLATLLFKVKVAGSLLAAGLVLLLLMAASIGLGLLISSLVRTMRQAVMLVPLIVIPSVLISQTFSPIEVMPRFMQYVAYLSPMFYSNVALREIMIKATPLAEIAKPVIILALYAIITLAIGILTSKKRIE